MEPINVKLSPGLLPGVSFRDYVLDLAQLIRLPKDKVELILDSLQRLDVWVGLGLLDRTPDESLLRRQSAAYLQPLVEAQEALLEGCAESLDRFRWLTPRHYASLQVRRLEGQVAAGLVLARSDYYGSVRQGNIPPGTRLLLGRRSRPGKWGEGTWAPPMGGIELAKDEALPGPQRRNRSVLRALLRELDEEVKVLAGPLPLTRFVRDGFVIGGYRDCVRGRLLHLAVIDLPAFCDPRSRPGLLIAELLGGLHPLPVSGNPNEHSEFDWFPLDNLPNPMMPGTRYAIWRGLRHLLEIAQSKAPA